MTEPNDMPYELESLLHADGDGPARRIDTAVAERMVAQAIDAAAIAEVKPLRVKRYAWLLAAALVITGSAAAMYAAQQARVAPQDAERHAAIARAPHAPEPEVVAQPTPVAQPSSVQPTVEPQPAQPAPAVRAEPARPEHAEGGAGHVQDLLRRANRLRGEGQYRSAERTYLRVLSQSPNGAPAYSARVAAAALRIERMNDPRGALQLYADALRQSPDGPLSPEIHEGMAQAYRQLGQTAREHKALTALVAELPDGPAAERARARLRELDAAR